MDFITEKRFLIGLVIFNVLSVSLLLYREFGRRSPQLASFKSNEPPGMAAMLEEELKFDREQIDRFRKLRREFRREADRYKTERDDLRKQVMSETLGNKPDTGRINDLADQIGQAEINKTKLIADHFQKIKALCRPDQKENFNILLNDLSWQLGPPKPRPPRYPGRQPHHQPGGDMRPAHRP